MGGEVEALRGALERIAKRPFQKEREGRRERCPSCAYAWDLDDDRHKERHAESCDRIVATQALAASSPSPAQGGIDYSTLADLHTIKGWLHGLSTHPDLEDVVADGGVTAGMVYQQEAREFAGRIGRIINALAASPQPEAREARIDYLRKSRDGHAATAHAEFGKRVMATDALISAREALHQHYVDWDGEPEDAVPLQEARAECDRVLDILLTAPPFVQPGEGK